MPVTNREAGHRQEDKVVPISILLSAYNAVANKHKKYRERFMSDTRCVEELIASLPNRPEVPEGYATFGDWVRDTITKQGKRGGWSVCNAGRPKPGKSRASRHKEMRKKLGVTEKWYREYLKSDRWRKVNDLSKDKCRDSSGVVRCVDCGSDEDLNGHHRSYTWCNKGTEEQEAADVFQFCFQCHGGCRHEHRDNK